MTITINNAMGGETSEFLEQYVWENPSTGTSYTLTYTSSNAGGSGPGTGNEGWTVGGDAWQSGEPEIFYYGGTWYACDPRDTTWPQFSSFQSPGDPAGGLNYGSGQLLFDPPITGEHIGESLSLRTGGSPQPEPQWYDPGWGRRFSISARLGHTDTMTVDLAAVAPPEFWNEVQDGGTDVRVTLADGTTEVARHVVSCDTAAQTGELHFSTTEMQVPFLPGETFYIYYGNSSAADYDPAHAYGQHNAYPSDCIAALHMSEDSGAASAADATSNGNAPEIYDAIFGQSGGVGRALEFDNSAAERGDYLWKDGSFPEAEGTILVSATPTDLSTGRNFLLFGRSTNDWTSITDDAGGNRWQFFVDSGEWGLGVYQGTDLSVGESLETGSAHALGLAYDSGGRALFRDGAKSATDGTGGVNDSGSAGHDWFLGQNVNGIRNQEAVHSGRISEALIFSVRLSDEAIDAHLSCWHDQNAFWTAGPEETATIPSEHCGETLALRSGGRTLPYLEFRGQPLAPATGGGDSQSRVPEVVGRVIALSTGRNDGQNYRDGSAQNLLLSDEASGFQIYVETTGQVLAAGAAATDSVKLVENAGQGLCLLDGGADAASTRDETGRGQVLAVAVRVSDIRILPAEPLGQPALLTHGAQDHRRLPEHGGQVLSPVGAAGDLQSYVDTAGQVFRAYHGGADFGAFDEHHGQKVWAETGREVRQCRVPETVGQLLALPQNRSDLQHRNAEAHGAALLLAQACADIHLPYPPERAGARLLAAQDRSDIQRYLDAAGQMLRAAGDAWSMWLFPLTLQPDPDGGSGRKVRWEAPNAPADATFNLYVDGELQTRTGQQSYELRASETVRQYLQVGIPDTPTWEEALLTPEDEASLSWTGDAHQDPDGHYRVERSTDGGSTWETIATLRSLSYVDGPLQDGEKKYRIVAVDGQGDEATSSEATITVSSAPEPPSDLTISVDSGTATFNWTASPSSDVQDYGIWVSDAEGRIDLSAPPDYVTTGTSYDIDVSGWSGIRSFLVRARDTSGTWEAGIGQVATVVLDSGSETGLPAEPRSVTADPVSGGKVEVEFLYDPHYETNGPGVAAEARIYWDAGTGTMDWSSPHATLSLGGPTDAARYTWTSGALTDGQEYQFAVRIANSAGIETENEDTHPATPDSDVPATPTLSADVV